MDAFHAPRLLRLRFHAAALTPIELPPFTGSAWRGLLGTALRRAVCVPRQPACPGCLLTDRCAFHHLFETRVDPHPGVGTRYRTPSHP